MEVSELIATRRTVLSPCRTLRYALWREFGRLFDDGQYVLFIGLNRTTADETTDDETMSARAPLVVVAAWGNDGDFVGRDHALRTMIPDLHCLKITGQGNHTIRYTSPAISAR